MAYQALYRQWRPQCFEEVVGQQHVTQTLRHAIESDRLAHAYLFSGPRGVGKTSTARILAKAVNCQDGPTAHPCGKCRYCLNIANNRALDVIEIDAASNNGVDEIRELREKVKYAPAECRYKVYIIDEVHMLSTAAFNALLKTLEEPPKHVIFILATTEVQKIPPTIVSRCQRFEFQRILVATIEDQLQKLVDSLNVTIQPEARRLIARAADGGMRDAISILDQCIAYTSAEIKLNDVTDLLGTLNDETFFLLTQHIHEKQLATSLAIIGEAYQRGKNLEQFLKDYLFYLRGLLQLLAGIDDVTIVITDMNKVKEQAQQVGKDAILSLIHVLVKAENEMRYATNKLLVLEMAIIESQYYLQDELVHLNARISKLEKLIQQSERSQFERQQVPVEPKQQKLEESAAEAAKTQQGKQREKPQRTNKKQKQIKERAPQAPPKIKPEPKGDLQLTTLQRQWSTILQHVKGRDVITHALLHKARPSELNGKELVMQFESQFHCDQITSPAKSKILLDVIEKMYGQRLKIVGVVTADQATKGNNSKSENLPKDDMVQKALEIFGGRIVNEEGKHV